MLFSVVIPTFNRLQYLPGTLARVRAQRFTDFETVVVDDGSTDGTRDYLASVPGIRVIQQANAGPGAARNAGVAVAKGDYIAFLDSDDVWFPWTLDVAAQVVSNRPVAVIASSFSDFHRDSELESVRECAVNVEYFRDYLSSAQHPISVGSCAAVFSRTSFLDAGGFSHRRMNAEDHDLALRLGVAVGFAHVRGPLMVGWRRHPDSLTGDLSKTVDGLAYMVTEEQAGRYPGGPGRAHERQQIITRHLRPMSFAALGAGNVSAAAELYRMAFRWHLRSARLNYLAAFPIALAWRALKGTAQRST
jgi:cellulose synthase/poly-beta-1,6-N-acetylglucosamine synthase-like glycosyltransferase